MSDSVGEAEDDQTGVGGHVFGAVASEEFFAESVFEPLELFGDGGLGHVERGGGAGENPFFSDGPEITQTMIIEPFHAGWMILRNNLTN